MKTILLLMAMAFVLPRANAQFTTADVQATGLTCAMCSNAIYKALTALPFVESVKPDIKNSAFHVAFKYDTEVELDEIKKAVEDAGFSIGSMKVTGRFEDVQLNDDGHAKIGDDAFHFLGLSDQVLNGEKTITIVDKDYVTAKQFKKYSGVTSMACLKTGKAADCCMKAGVPSNTRIYHVII